MIITISGQPGAGSTTIAKMLAEKTKHKLITVGEINKQIAKEQGMEIGEFWEHLKKNPEQLKKFHKQLDEKQKKLAVGNVIMNGKLSAFQIPHADLKILLTADVNTRAARTVKRDGGTIKEAAEKITKREKNERKEWKKIYKFDYVKDTEYYDMIINTTKLSPEEIVEKITQSMEE